MTVQELIDALMKVEDKNKVVKLHSGKTVLTFPIFDMIEYQDSVVLYDY